MMSTCYVEGGQGLLLNVLLAKELIWDNVNNSKQSAANLLCSSKETDHDAAYLGEVIASACFEHPFHAHHLSKRLQWPMAMASALCVFPC